MITQASIDLTHPALQVDESFKYKAWVHEDSPCKMGASAVMDMRSVLLMFSDNREDFTRSFVFLGKLGTLTLLSTQIISGLCSVEGLLFLAIKWRYSADGVASSNALWR